MIISEASNSCKVQKKEKKVSYETFLETLRDELIGQYLSSQKKKTEENKKKLKIVVQKKNKRYREKNREQLNFNKRVKREADRQVEQSSPDSPVSSVPAPKTLQQPQIFKFKDSTQKVIRKYK
jgi:CRISPR/Cas system endoribonuclease Cas6 (RAMP superfamily)